VTSSGARQAVRRGVHSAPCIGRSRARCAGGPAGAEMHSWTFRLNAIFTFTVTVLAVLSALNALSVAFLNPEPVATIENVKLQRLPGSGSLRPRPAPPAPPQPRLARARSLSRTQPWLAARSVPPPRRVLPSGVFRFLCNWLQMPAPRCLLPAFRCAVVWSALARPRPRR